MAPETESRQRVQRLAEEALGHLEAELKAGRSEALSNYLAAMGRFHRYSWTNSLLIQTQRPTATRVAGYHTWADLGRHVRRGEKGIVIYAPLITKGCSPNEAAPRDQAQQPSTRLVGFRAAYVFDVEQTDGKPLPVFATTRGDPQDFSEKLKAFVSSQNIALRFDDSLRVADGISEGGLIRIKPGMSPAEEFSVLAHELAHEMLHHGPDRPKLPTVVRETQAEAVAYVICKGIGLDTGTAARDYIALYNGDAKTLAESLAAIQETSSRILHALLPEERRRPDRSEQAARDVDTLPSRADSIGAPPRSTAETPTPSDSISMDR